MINMFDIALMLSGSAIHFFKNTFSRVASVRLEIKAQKAPAENVPPLMQRSPKSEINA